MFLLQKKEWRSGPNLPEAVTSGIIVEDATTR
jgi:hypothetical protein